MLRSLFRIVLGLGLIGTGTVHFRSPDSFLAQLPPWMPLPHTIIYVSGAIEIVFGVALILVVRFRREIGLATAAFFVAVFPGNISQWVTQTDGFGLDSDSARFIRLLFQPLLVLWAIWSTRASSSNEDDESIQLGQ